MKTLFAENLRKNPVWLAKNVKDLTAGNHLGFFNPLYGLIKEGSSRFMNELPVPGFTRNDINIQVSGLVMEITAKRRKTDVDSLPFGTSFYRSITLPSGCDLTNIDAKCHDGLLIVQLGKLREGISRRVIKVNHGASGNKSTKSSNWYSPVLQWWKNVTQNTSAVLPQSRLSKRIKAA